jgi:hypothetical protein
VDHEGLGLTRGETHKRAPTLKPSIPDIDNTATAAVDGGGQFFVTPGGT